MKQFRRLLVLALLLMAGCSPPRLPDGRFGTSRVDRDTSVGYITTGDNLYLVWTDISFDDLPVGTGGGSGWTDKNVNLHSHNRRWVTMKVWTQDGKTLRVEVNGREYPVEGGTLFTAKARGEVVEVQQIQHELTGLSPTDETWQRLASENKVISDFIADAKRR